MANVSAPDPASVTDLATSPHKSGALWHPGAELEACADGTAIKMKTSVVMASLMSPFPSLVAPP